MRSTVSFLNLILALRTVSSLESGIFSNYEYPIVGGEDVLVLQFPYMASLRKSGAHHCGSAILSEQWAITAAHCFYNSEDIEEFTLRTGESNRLFGGVFYNLKTVKVHEKFMADNIDYDIALIELEKPIGFDAKTSSIPLPALGYNNIKNGTMASVIGWGYLSEEGPLSINLQRAFVPIVQWSFCKQLYQDYRNVTSRMICAGYMEGNRDACQSDSGGPLIYQDCLVGLVSWGRGCGRPLSPGVYTSISYFIPWILNTTHL